MKPKQKRKPQEKKQRSLNAINAHFRNSAGPMKDNKKEQSKQSCRKKVDEED